MLLANATLVTMNDRLDVISGNLRIEGGRITGVGSIAAEPDEQVIDVSNCIIMPGLIQAHLHLCQTLFRNAAENLELLDWLRLRIWPLEAAHTPESLFATACLGIRELLLGGITGVLDMGTVHHTDAIFEAARLSGIRAAIGKAMMDQGDAVPAGLRETTDASLTESVRLLEHWHGSENNRLRYAFAPRFVPSCTSQLLREVVDYAETHQIGIHTHASENQKEIDLVRAMTGLDNIEYLDRCGLSGSRVRLAHCVWVSEAELATLAKSQTVVLHCPASNLKLASGIAPIPAMLQRKIRVALGSDGAACSNRLDSFDDMRLAGLLQKPLHGPTVLSAQSLLWMATRGGAAALGLEDQVGALEPGRLADLVILELDELTSGPVGDIYDRIVWSSDRGCVRSVIVDGRFVVRDHQLVTLNSSDILRSIKLEGKRLYERANLSDLWRS